MTRFQEEVLSIQEITSNENLRAYVSGIIYHYDYIELLEGLDSDWSHNYQHIIRILRNALEISCEENESNIYVVVISTLFCDIARKLEDEGKTQNHAIEGSMIAKRILDEIGFNKDKTEKVCSAVLHHRKTRDVDQEDINIEAKIIRDADHLDLLGVVNIFRIAGSAFQSSKYKKPIYISQNDIYEKDNNFSVLKYMSYELEKLHPKHFLTQKGCEMATKRYDISKIILEQFLSEIC
jgi:uncharacterized protein